MPVQEEQKYISSEPAQTPATTPTLVPEASPTPVPTPTVVPTPTAEPTPTPDPSAPTIETAQQKILELQTKRRLQESRISQMKQVIRTEESDIQNDWNALQSRYKIELRKAEESLTETRYKTVKRIDYYGRERRVRVPYEHEKLGGKINVSKVKNAFHREKRKLASRNTNLTQKKRALSEAEQQVDITNAHIIHLENWIVNNR